MRHRHVVVRDDQELPLPAQPREHLAESADVGVVERGVDLVEDRERARVDLVERQHQRERGQRPLAGRQQGHVLQPLARRLDEDLDAGARAVVAVGVAQGRATSGRELREVLVEVGGDRAEDRLVARLLFLAQLGDQLLEVVARGRDVVAAACAGSRSAPRAPGIRSRPARWSGRSPRAGAPARASRARAPCRPGPLRARRRPACASGSPPCAPAGAPPRA